MRRGQANEQSGLAWRSRQIGAGYPPGSLPPESRRDTCSADRALDSVRAGARRADGLRTPTGSRFPLSYSLEISPR